MKLKITIVIIFFFNFLFTSSAQAYLDPGSSSILLQAIIGFIASLITTLTIFWNKFKNFIKKIFKLNKKN